MREIIDKQPCITFVTLGELTEWTQLRQWGRRNRDALGHWLDGVIVLPYTDDVIEVLGVEGHQREVVREGAGSDELPTGRTTSTRRAWSAWLCLGRWQRE
jgi:hypothetical protein